MRISIFGLGYVGAVSGACLADQGHEVIGVDTNPEKVRMIADGHAPIVEELIAEVTREAVATGKLKATLDGAAAIRQSDVAMISVGTPTSPLGRPMLDTVDSVTRFIGGTVKTLNKPFTVVVRSTIPPGYTEGRLMPLLEEAAGRKIGDGLSLVFNPEFLREGRSVQDFREPPFTVIGSSTEAGYRAVEDMYAGIKAPVIRTSCGAAESIKILSNAFHALKITFANETARLCESLGVDPFQVMDLVCRDTHLNISRAYLKPGFAFGGSCLPKDLRATAYLAKTRDVEVPMLGAVLQSNRVHLEHAIAKIAAHGRRRIGLIGLSFKAGTDDLRESPLVALAEHLIGKGMKLLVHDPEVRLSRLLGANRRYIENHVPHIGSLMRDDLAAVVGDSEVVVVGLNDARTMDGLAKHLRDEHVVIDLVNLPDRARLRGTFVGLCW
jgi:GDP-mannose 6-dehydrogenase